MALWETTQHVGQGNVGVGHDWFRFNVAKFKLYGGGEHELLPTPRYDKQLLSFENVKSNLKIQQYTEEGQNQGEGHLKVSKISYELWSHIYTTRQWEMEDPCSLWRTCDIYITTHNWCSGILWWYILSYCRTAVPQGCSTKGLPLGARQFPAKSVSHQTGAYKRRRGQRIGEKAGGLYCVWMVVPTCDVRFTIKLHIRWDSHYLVSTYTL